MTKITFEVASFLLEQLMCLILFAWKVHPHQNLILAANRDEFYERPTKQAGFWSDHSELLAGKDITGGGTWLGITKSGRFVALTNYRDSSNISSSAPSRGHLTKDFLLSDSSPKKYLEGLLKGHKPYNGYNLLIGNHDELWYFNNVNHELKLLSPGIYGLSNGLLDDPWPKVEKGKLVLKLNLSNDSIDTENLFRMLTNDTVSKDENLPATGVPIEWERMLSPLFISSEEYGTRCSTVILINKFETHFSEKSYQHIGQKESLVHFKI